VLDFSAFHGEEQGPTLVTRLAGFVADAVERVGLVYRDGHTEWVAVSDNIYELDDPPSGPVVALVAKDQAGKTLYSETFGG
jgi:hypothetical protein